MKSEEVGWKTVMMTVVFLLAAVVGFAEGPSFDCKEAKKCAEKLICNNTELSRLDGKMSEVYGSLLSRLKGKDKENVKLTQVRWIKARDRRCEPGVKYETLFSPEKEHYEDLFTNLYTERIEELEEWKQYLDGEKTANFPPWQTKCWKRQEPATERFSTITGDEPVCRAFEQVLNTTCEAPKKLERNWTLPLDEKRFQKLIWQPLDWREYWGLIEDMVKAAVREDMREEVWRRTETTLRKEFEEGRRRLSVTTVDFGNFYGSKLVVRDDTVPPPGTVFGVMIPETKRLDWRYVGMLFSIYFREGAEIMLYNGKPFMFNLQGGPEYLLIWDENHNIICTFEYLKGGK